MGYRITGSLLLLAALATSARADNERIALCIGINRYDDSGFEVLSYAENDATAFAGLLRDAGYKVVLMTDTTGKVDPKLVPTKANIETQLTLLVEKRKRDQLVILAFAGHGFEFGNDSDTYFCPADAEPFAEKKNTMLSIDGIYARLNRCGAGTKLLLADCCRNDPNPARGRGPDDTLEKTPPKGVLALYACAPSQRAYEFSKLKHGVFFHHMIEGIRGQAGKVEKNLVFEELVAHVRDEVPATVKRLTGNTKKQNPTQKGLPPDGDPVVLFTTEDRRIIADGRVMEHCLYDKGDPAKFFKENAPTHLADWKAAAERGSVRGMVMYADCLNSDDATAVDWYRKAAELGSPSAMMRLGVHYMSARGVRKDPAEAVKWYRRAAILGDPEAMEFMGICYLMGVGVEKDSKLAFEWYRKAADCGLSRAMVGVGLSYLHGSGIKKDQNTAVEWFQKAIELGNSSAMYHLAQCYKLGSGVGRDAREAVKWYRKAAELGNMEAMTDLGLCYGGGIGVTKDPVEGAKWFQNAAELGHPLGMLYLGTCYGDGLGVEKDWAEAVKWYRKAAELGETQAMFNLGVCYSAPFGVKQDLVEAIKWLRKGAELGNVKAMKLLATFYGIGIGVKQDDKMAFGWHSKAAARGDPEAMCSLADCYLQGRGVTKDESKAVELYRKAAKLGNQEAKEALKRLDKE